MGLEGFRGDLCLCLDFGTEPRAIQLPKASWIAPRVRSPGAVMGARHQKHMQMAGHSLGPTSGGGLLPQPPVPAREDVFRQVLIAFLLRLFQALSGNESTDTLAHPSVCPPAAQGGNGCSGVKSV